MLRELFSRISDDHKARSPLDTAAQQTASVVAPFYGAGAAINRLLYSVGIKKSTTLPARVISVGNITLGGTGKTPFCLWLADFLREERKHPAILTRGYGREDESRLVVVHDGKQLLANTRAAGDEPVLLAKALGDVPVIACADRARAGKVALRKFEVDTLVLDDGFQHHALTRQADVVLVDCTRRLSRLRVFPRGSLRESPAALTRAHLIVLTRWQQSKAPRAVLREVQKLAPHVPIVRSRMAITGAARVATREALSLESLRGTSAFLLCAVGNPASVRRSVEELGIRVVGLKNLPDHARYTKELVLRCDSIRRRLGAEHLIVTEKDAVKLVEMGNLPPEVITLRAKVQMLTEKDEELAKRTLRARMEAKGVRGLLKG